MGSADEAAHAADDAEALAAIYRLHNQNAVSPMLLFSICCTAPCKMKNLPRLTVRLKAAISQFDNAAIYTIHGFCQRLLRDYAFLCQVPFDTELAEHKRERLLTPAKHFWRTEVAADVHKARLVFKHRYTPKTCWPKSKNTSAALIWLSDGLEWIWPPPSGFAAKPGKASCPSCPELMETFWQNPPRANGTVYRKNTFEARLPGADEALPQPARCRKRKMAADVLSAAMLERQTRKKAEAVQCSRFRPPEALADLGRYLDEQNMAEENALIALQIDLLTHINHALAEQKSSRERGLRRSLLLHAHHASAKPAARAFGRNRGEKLARGANRRISIHRPAAIRHFPAGLYRPRQPAVSRGRPKQAIYKAFVCRDLAHRKPAEDAEHHYTLATNRRSHATINGISALFR